ncbi:hypothetical protein BPC006_II2007 [Burkholderia pseudomallei BPC006]|nr:hypothetical protein BPC006_II2007 [Burkholderia pseudomallei BPC006]
MSLAGDGRARMRAAFCTKRSKAASARQVSKERRNRR